MVEQFLAALASNPADVDALIGLARLGTIAHPAAPVVIRSITAVQDPRFRAICFDVLGAVLEDHEGDEAREAVALLAQAMEDPAYHRMRGKIARTLLKIGFAARDAIPVLARTLRKGARDSVHFPLKCTLVWLAWECWLNQSADAQKYTILAMEGFSRSQRSWMIDKMLDSREAGSEVRCEAQRLRNELSE